MVVFDASVEGQHPLVWYHVMSDWGSIGKFLAWTRLHPF